MEEAGMPFEPQEVQGCMERKMDERASDLDQSESW